MRECSIWPSSLSCPPTLLTTHTHPQSNLTYSYDIFAINIASTMLGYVYNKNGKLNINQDLGVKVATPIGTLIGQLLFGWLADVVGRKRMCTCMGSTWTDMGLIFRSRRY